MSKNQNQNSQRSSNQMLDFTQTKDPQTAVDIFIGQLQRRQIQGPYQTALATAQLFLRVVSAARWSHIDQLYTQLRLLGKRLIQAAPCNEMAVGNTVRRVLFVLREECLDNSLDEQSSAPNASPFITHMFNLLSTRNDTSSNNTTKDQLSSLNIKVKNDGRDLKSQIIGGIQLIIDEIDNVDAPIASLSLDLIHENEVLLTPTPASTTVLKFLLKAATKRKMTVLVCEGFPTQISAAQQFTRRLASAGIESIIIPDSAVYSVMARVGKVIIGPTAVLANGAALTEPGVDLVCQCAREHKTAVLGCVGIYRLSPVYPFDLQALISVGNPSQILPYTESELIDKLDLVNPLCDYLNPDLIDLYLTNVGGYSPSFMYRLVLDNYSQQDVDL